MKSGLTRALMVAVLPLAAVGQDGASWYDEPDRIVVTTSPTGNLLAEAMESVTVIDRTEIQSQPVTNLADLLDMVAGVDIRRRGAAGVQADVGIRGTAYEQTLMLVNGIPIKDPQTGHHDLNLPVPLEHVERIEVVRGPGGIAWGGNATGGLVNIITRQPDGSEYGVSLRAGSFSIREARIHAGTGGERSGHMLSASGLSSDGHLPVSRSDSDLRRAMYTGHARFEHGTLGWGLGAEEKAFGAWKFYTADFPDQREETASRLAYLSAQAGAGGWDMDARLFWRSHDDWFRTRVGETEFINEHETDVRGARIDGRRKLAGGVFAAGAGLTLERIDSSALDDHRRDESSIWFAHRHPLGARSSVEVGVNTIRFSDYGTELLPSVGFGYRLSSSWHAHLSSARTARVPSWTGRFLVTGGNVGLAGLEPERSTLHEAGLRYAAGEHRVVAAMFERRTDRLIDWARAPGEVTWQAGNIDGHRSRGSEVEWQWRPDSMTSLESVRAGLTLLSSRVEEAGREFKYVTDYPRQALTTALALRPAEHWRVSLAARHQRRELQSSISISARLARHFGSLSWFVEAENLLDEEVIEAGFAPLPGRAWFAGVEWRGR